MPINDKTKKLLWVRSAGYCQNPSCNVSLYTFFQDGTFTNIEELAHIVAEKETGPRGGMEIKDRDSYENIIVLCPNCHTKIDKNPDIYSAEEIQKWKETHKNRIEYCFNAPAFESRESMLSELKKITKENKSVFDEYGPFSEYAEKSVISDASKMWHLKSIEKIIPNNRKILEILQKNVSLLSEEEVQAMEKFKLHKEGFEYNKLSGDKNSAVPLYPEEITKLINNA